MLLPDGTILKVDVWSSVKNQTERYNPITGVWTSAGLTPSVLPDNGAHTNGTSTSFSKWDQDYCGPMALSSGSEPLRSQRPPGTRLFTTRLPTRGRPDRTFQTMRAAMTHRRPCCPMATCWRSLHPQGRRTCSERRASFMSSTALISARSGCPPTARAVRLSIFIGTMLVLPTGQVLVTEQSSHIELYTPSGSANGAWLPTITAVSSVVDRGSTYTISGTQFNGLGASRLRR